MSSIDLSGFWTVMLFSVTFLTCARQTGSPSASGPSSSCGSRSCCPTSWRWRSRYGFSPLSARTDAHKLLGEHRQDVGQGLDEGDLDLARDLRVPLGKVLGQEVVQLSSCNWSERASKTNERTVLDASRSAAHDDHVKQALDLRLGLALEGGRLDAWAISKRRTAATDNPSGCGGACRRPRAAQSEESRAGARTSFRKQACSLTPGMPNVAFSAPMP